jgi:hypothetical protein
MWFLKQSGLIKGDKSLSIKQNIAKQKHTNLIGLQ